MSLCWLLPEGLDWLRPVFHAEAGHNGKDQVPSKSLPHPSLNTSWLWSGSHQDPQRNACFTSAGQPWTAEVLCRCPQWSDKCRQQPLHLQLDSQSMCLGYMLCPTPSMARSCCQCCLPFLAH